MWHVAGNSSFHRHNASRDFIELCKQKLNQTKLSIFVGNTGYVRWKEQVPTGVYTWDVDELGRFVAVLNDIWLFQRYTNGDTMVWTPIKCDGCFDWNGMSSEKLEELTKSISNL